MCRTGILSAWSFNCSMEGTPEAAEKRVHRLVRERADSEAQKVRQEGVLN